MAFPGSSRIPFSMSFVIWKTLLIQGDFVPETAAGDPAQDQPDTFQELPSEGWIDALGYVG